MARFFSYFLDATCRYLTPITVIFHDRNNPTNKRRNTPKRVAVFVFQRDEAGQAGNDGRLHFVYFIITLTLSAAGHSNAGKRGLTVVSPWPLLMSAAPVEGTGCGGVRQRERVAWKKREGVTPWRKIGRTGEGEGLEEVQKKGRWAQGIASNDWLHQRRR